jgi:hypothetical protein
MNIERSFSMRFSKYLLVLGVLALLWSSPKLISRSSADGGSNHQIRNTHFGVSGGNVNDRSKAFCCSGTLGALVKDSSGVLYILSNNHVLGRADQATVGDDISQPGLIDSGCQIATLVADFTVAPKLGSNVDAAIAQLKLNMMDETGFIEDIGVPGSALAATVGMAVAKSGRTTGFTTGTVGSIDTSVNVQYQKGCGSGKKFVVSYTNQVVIDSGSFSAGGDSGSLIVTNNASHNPVALLFAGSNTTTIGNPIGEVLIKVGQALGKTISFGGGGGGGASKAAPSATTLADNSPSSQDVNRAMGVKGRYERDLMSRPGVIGVGVGGSETNTDEATIVIYVDRTAGRRPALPEHLDDVRVRVVLTDPIVAY